MTHEIERRYLVRVPDGLWHRLERGRRLRQAYLRAGNPSVRIRFGEPRGPVLTCKRGRGVRREEAETVVPEDVALILWAAGEGRVIEKVRYRLGRWELDRFLGPLAGLTLLEIELDHEDEPIPEPPAGVQVIDEVTNRKGFSSGQLASLRDPEARAVVTAAYDDRSGAPP